MKAFTAKFWFRRVLILFFITLLINLLFVLFFMTDLAVYRLEIEVNSNVDEPGYWMLSLMESNLARVEPSYLQEIINWSDKYHFYYGYLGLIAYVNGVQYLVASPAGYMGDQRSYLVSRGSTGKRFLIFEQDRLPKELCKDIFAKLLILLSVYGALTFLLYRKDNNEQKK